MQDLQEFQRLDKYARFDAEKGRRETWAETVQRTVNHLRKTSEGRLSDDDYDAIYNAIYHQDVMPSMRLLAMAGPAAERNSLALFNCAAIAIDDPAAFVEALIISMSGCGVGFSVEKQFVDRLPRVKPQVDILPLYHIVADSAEGWASALRLGLEQWFYGTDVIFNYDLVRPAGAILKTKGGRSSGPGALRDCLDNIRHIILERQGDKLRPIDAHDIMCHVGSCAVSGGSRRTAMISLFDADDDEMLHAKDYPCPTQRWNANNSAVWTKETTDKDIREQFYVMHQGMNGEPGFFNRPGVLASLPERRNHDFIPLTNPCVTGDTWVAVADGRGRVRIADLAEQGEDVDVYTTKEGKLTVRTMRNPRVTGYNVPIYKVNFADGSSIRVTENHTFVLKNGLYKEAKDLQENDSLSSMTMYSYKKKGLPKTKKVSYDDDGSYRMICHNSMYKSEHRFLYAHHNACDPLSGIDYHIHHRDYDGRNNAIENLELISADDHAALHRDRMLGKNNPAHRMTDQWRENLSKVTTGENNPRYCGVTNEELEERILGFIRTLGYRPSAGEYEQFAKKEGLPQTFSKMRRNYFGGGVDHTLRTLAVRCNIHQPHYAKAKGLGITYGSDGATYVEKNCEVCGKAFVIPFTRREQANCSNHCGSIMVAQKRSRNGTDHLPRHYTSEAHNAWVASIRAGWEKRKVSLREQQVEVYLDLQSRNMSAPQKSDWITECSKRNISPEISRKTSPFRYWRDLKEAASYHNHRVVSVELDGCEDVYTGTVDDTHTYFAIGTARNSNGVEEMSYVENRQCGEIFMRHDGSLCNLSSVICRPEDTFFALERKVRIATIIGTIQSLETNYPGLRPQWERNAKNERLLGVDLNGQMDAPHLFTPENLQKLRDVAISTNVEYAEKLGINPSAAITTTKPSGNASVLTNASSGVHARYSPYYVRNARISTSSPIFKLLLDQNVPMDPENGQERETANTFVIHWPVKSPEGAVTVQNRSAIDQLEYWKMVKTNWAEHSVSCTISYRPEELDAIISWVVDNRPILSGLSFLPLSDAKYDQMPYEPISKQEYEERMARFPHIEWELLRFYEQSDNTSASQELSCTASGCETI